MLGDIMNEKTEISLLSYLVPIFKCFKGDIFKKKFSIKFETIRVV